MEDPPSSALRAPPAVAARANCATTVTLSAKITTKSGVSASNRWICEISANFELSRVLTRPKNVLSVFPRASTRHCHSSTRRHVGPIRKVTGSSYRSSDDSQIPAKNAPIRHCTPPTRRWKLLRVGSTRLRRCFSFARVLHTPGLLRATSALAI